MNRTPPTSSITRLPVSHSVIDADAIGELVEKRFNLGRITRAILYRSWANEVYLVESAEGPRYFFKVARRAWRSVEDAAWEVQLQRHLQACGIPIAAPIPQRNGDMEVLIDAPEGHRAAVLYAEAPGAKPHPPHDSSLYEAFGRASARMHTAMDDFAAPTSRPARSTEWLVHKSSEIVMRELCEKGDDRAFLADFSRKLGQELERRSPGLEFGLVHGDLTLDNLTVDSSGIITFFDFDLAAYGWRATEMAGLYAWSLREPVAIPYFNAFMRGYRAVRPWSPEDKAALPYVAAACELWELAHEIEHWRHWSGLWRSTEAVIQDRINRLRSLQESIGHS